jgi:methionyl-tRNA formyltransferase
MRIAIYASGEKALSSIAAVHEDHLVHINTVIIGTDSKVQQDFSEAIEAICSERNIAYSFEDTVSGDIEVFIAIGWRKLIQKHPHQKLIVLHDSILPRYRGFNPLVTALINGDTEIGVTALIGEETYDSGPVIALEKIQISYPIRIAEAIQKISRCYEVLLQKVLNALLNDDLTATPQDNDAATYSLWRDSEDYFINWNWSSEKILRCIHAVGFPYDGAKFRLKDEVYTVTEATLVPDVIIENRDVGKVIFKSEGKPVVVCGLGLLRLDMIFSESATEEKFNNKFRLRLT